MFTDPLDPSIAIPGVYYVDYSSNVDGTPGDPDFSYYNCALPEKLTFNDSISGPGTASWEWTFSALDGEVNPIVSHNFIGPWRSYYRLRCGNDIIMAGPITGVSSKYGDQFMSVGGGTWESFLGRYQYPFDPRPDHVNDYRYSNSLIGNEDTPGSGMETPTGLAYQAYNRDVILIAQNLLYTTMHAVPNRLIFDTSRLLNPIGIRTNYQFSLGDETYMDSVLNSLASIGEGFDWWIGTVDRAMRIGSPYRYGSNMSPATYYDFTVDSPGLIDVSFDNNGPQGTHILGSGAGLATSTTLKSAFGSRSNQEIFNRLDASYDFGDVRNRNQLEMKTRKKLALMCQPEHVVSVTVDPAQIPNFWPTFRKGRAVTVAIDFGWHQITGKPFQISSLSCNGVGEETGTMSVDLTLKQIYPIEVTDSEFYPYL